MDAPGALEFSYQLPVIRAVISLDAMPEPCCCSFLFFFFNFPQVFCLKHFCVCLTRRGPRANNISKTFCHNFECQIN